MSGRRLLLAVFLVLAVVGLFRLRIDVDILNLLPADIPVARGLAEYQDKFLQAGEVIVVLRSSDSESNLQGVRAIVAAARDRTNLIDRVFWQPPANESLGDAAQFLAYLWLNSPTDTVAVLRENLKPENLSALLEQSRERIATSFNPTDLFLLPRDPLNLSSVGSAASETFETPEKFFSSEDGRTRLIYIYSAVPLGNYEQCRDWVRELRGMITESLRRSKGSSFEFRMTGRPVFVDEISSGMRSDMSTAVPGTLLLIGLLFYLLHREIVSLVLLLSTLFLVMVWAALAGSAIIGQLNVVSLGFASILLGLAEDFGIVLHQEVKSHPGADAATIRRIAGPGVFWSAITTASAFALLNLSALPGLRNLGTLVALGILIGAWAMLHIFLPLVVRYRRPSEEKMRSDGTRSFWFGRYVGAITVVFLLLGIFSIWRMGPILDSSPDVLRPRRSEASEALRIVQDTLGTSGDPFWLLVQGESAEAVRQRLEILDRHLATNSGTFGIDSFTLPLTVWPDVQAQRANGSVLKSVAAGEDQISRTVLANGFTSDALEISGRVFEEWQSVNSNTVNWPAGRIADWVLPKFVSRTGTNLMALGLITPGKGFNPNGLVPEELSDSVLLSGWSLLGENVLRQVKRETPVITALVGVTVILALWLTFRKFRPVLLSLAVLAFSGVVLLAMMGLLKWHWNLINLTALPLLLGMGIDYSIHILTTLERCKGNATETFNSVGRALLLAGSTTIIGFAFLGMSSNLGMASLGRVCALGLTILLLTSVFLLPGWARRSVRSL